MHATVTLLLLLLVLQQVIALCVQVQARGSDMAVCLCALQQANLLLMDSVAGVGYSYSLDTNDYTTNDTQAQIDMEATLRTWFQEYPYFANHSVILEGSIMRQHSVVTCSHSSCST